MGSMKRMQRGEPVARGGITECASLVRWRGRGAALYKGVTHWVDRLRKAALAEPVRSGQPCVRRTDPRGERAERGPLSRDLG